MYLRRLDIEYLKLIRGCALDLVDPRTDAPRMWTVLIGRNGRGKTSILRSIAALSAGYVQASNLAKPWILSLPDRRAPHPERDRPPVGSHPATPLMRAYFSIGIEAQDAAGLPSDAVGIFSLLSHLRGETEFTGWSRCHAEHLRFPMDRGWQSDKPLTSPDPFQTTNEQGRPTPPDHALVGARRKQAPHLFVAGYGNSRRLHRPGSVEARSGHEHRLASLFDPDYRITGLDFDDKLGNGRRDRYRRLLTQALFGVDGLMHEIGALDLADIRFDDSGVPDAIQQDLAYRARLDLPGGPIEIPTAWLSDGPQALIAWLADLIGHLMLDQPEVTDPTHYQGLVLVDDIDLHIHPDWQTRLIPALKAAFPRLQFIVTTHSPLLLASLRPEEVITLDLDAEGNIVTRSLQADPRLMTATELYRHIFEVEDTPPGPLHRTLRRYEYLARDPIRSTEEQERMLRWRAELEAEGVGDLMEPRPWTPDPNDP